MPITRKILMAYDWVTVFEAPTIKVMAAQGNSDVHVLHAKKEGSKVRIEYNVFGRRFASPSEAIKYYNAEEARRIRAAIDGRRYHPSRSAQPAAPREGTLPRR